MMAFRELLHIGRPPESSAADELRQQRAAAHAAAREASARFVEELGKAVIADLNRRPNGGTT